MKLSWIAFLFWSLRALAADGVELDRFLAEVKSLSASFIQQTLDEHGQVSRQNFGRFYLKRPGRFRWNYETPYRQEIVADGDKVWFYDPDLAQVTVKNIDAALGSAPALLLSGKLELKQRFVIVGQGKEKERAWVELKPKSEEDVFRSLRVELVRGILAAMEIADNFGHLTRILFEHVQLNPILADGLFRFVPPPNADIFEG
ncbi:MAG: outer membrane lipoprotein chaperone LolA [Methylohalobius sp.]|nr:outer membrane lipoprotein chaperone LolA [Methylohalobius sp.]